MKYFTSEWWATEQDDFEKIFKEYDEYFVSIKSKLPNSLVELYENHTLHDSRVTSIRSDFDKRKVLLDLLGWDIHLNEPVLYNLVFDNVSFFIQDLPKERAAWSELGDLGYWECEWLAKQIEIRMIFASGAEFKMVFDDFSFNYEKVRT